MAFWGEVIHIRLSDYRWFVPTGIQVLVDRWWFFHYPGIFRFLPACSIPQDWRYKAPRIGKLSFCPNRQAYQMTFVISALEISLKFLRHRCVLSFASLRDRKYSVLPKVFPLCVFHHLPPPTPTPPSLLPFLTSHLPFLRCVGLWFANFNFRNTSITPCITFFNTEWTVYVLPPLRSICCCSFLYFCPVFRMGWRRLQFISLILEF